MGETVGLSVGGGVLAVVAAAVGCGVILAPVGGFVAAAGADELGNNGIGGLVAVSIAKKGSSSTIAYSIRKSWIFKSFGATISTQLRAAVGIASSKNCIARKLRCLWEYAIVIVSCFFYKD